MGLNIRSQGPSWIFLFFLLLCFHSRRRQHGTCSQWLVRSGSSAHTKTWGFAQNQNTHDNTTHHPAHTSHHPPLTTHHGTNMHTYIHTQLITYHQPPWYPLCIGRAAESVAHKILVCFPSQRMPSWQVSHEPNKSWHAQGYVDHPQIIAMP